ncbi:MAG: hypothetical protein AAFQ51_08800, partial [Pseudomonadota bacterium]
DLIRITTLNVSRSRLPYDTAWAWRFRVGAEDRDLACDDCLVGFVEGGIGGSRMTPDASLAAAALIEARLTSTDEARLRGHAGPALQIVGALAPWAKAELSAAYELPFADIDSRRWRLGGELRLGASQTWDVRLSADGLVGDDGDGVAEVGLAASLFF